MTVLTPIAAGLWTDEAEPRLIGGQHRISGEIVFPMPLGDAATQYEPLPLARRGTLWSWTVQSFRPKSPPYAGPEQFIPFALGYVELPGQVIVETRLTQTGGLTIGMAMELTIEPFDDTRSTFAFRPAGPAA